MGAKTDTYIRGMGAINHFYSMLYSAMREAIPDAQISQSGAYVWQGFLIDSYKELAYSQFSCQIYPGIYRFLIFQESYLDDKRKATDFEIQHGIMQGRYYYPFSYRTDLIWTRFFDFNKGEQFSFLKNFVASAAEMALLWQKSEARAKVTRMEFLQGEADKHISVPVTVRNRYEKVGGEFLQAWEFQRSLFDRLDPILRQIIDKENDDEWVRPNASVYHFGQRGLRLKSKMFDQTSRWSLFFDEPEKLKFHRPKGRDWERNNSYHLVEHNYFDLSPDEQTKQLKDFVQACLGVTF